MHQFDTSTFTSLREYRHAAGILINDAQQALSGRSGMTEEDIQENLANASAALKGADAIVTQAGVFQAGRDFDAHQEAKQDVGPPEVDHLYEAPYGNNDDVEEDEEVSF